MNFYKPSSLLLANAIYILSLLLDEICVSARIEEVVKPESSVHFFNYRNDFREKEDPSFADSHQDVPSFTQVFPHQIKTSLNNINYDEKETGNEIINASRVAFLINWSDDKKMVGYLTASDQYIQSENPNLETEDMNDKNASAFSLHEIKEDQATDREVNSYEVDEENEPLNERENLSGEWLKEMRMQGKTQMRVFYSKELSEELAEMIIPALAKKIFEKMHIEHSSLWNLQYDEDENIGFIKQFFPTLEQYEEFGYEGELVEEDDMPASYYTSDGEISMHGEVSQQSEDDSVSEVKGNKKNGYPEVLHFGAIQFSPNESVIIYEDGAYDIVRTVAMSTEESILFSSLFSNDPSENIAEFLLVPEIEEENYEP